MSYQWITLAGYSGEFARAAWLTLQITLLSFALALLLGLLTTLAGASRLRAVSIGYIELIRNTPMLLQVFIVFFGLPSLGIVLDAYTAGIIALGLNGGAYLAEIFRSGIQSVPKGQIEAATIIGIGRRDILIYVVLPQAARAVYSAIVNSCTMSCCWSSIASLILVMR